MAASSTQSLATLPLTPSSSAPLSPSGGSVGPIPPAESFDDLGDLQLIVGASGPDQGRFIVCSRALSRASPVFKAMLGGPWLEKRPANSDADWVVELPEDERRYMKIVFALAHGRFRNIPRRKTLDDLYRLCFCIDKYDISECLKPWVGEWCRYVEILVVFTTIGAENAAKVLWIGWVLGDLKLVEKSAERLFESTKSSEVAALKPLDWTGLIGDIQKMQQEAARKIVSAVTAFWLSLKTVGELGGSGTRCLASSSRKLCDAATLGNLTASLLREDFLDSKVYDNFDIKSLLQAVSRIAENNVLLEGLGLDHRCCGPSRASRVPNQHDPRWSSRPSMWEELKRLRDRIKNDLPAPVTETARKFVAARARKIGIS